jgi:hypothetical protein
VSRRPSTAPAARRISLLARLQTDVAREELLALPPEKRSVLVGRADGYRDAELAGLLGMPTATIHSNRRHARQHLRDLAEAQERDPGGLRLRRAYEEMRGGNQSPAGARPVIAASWARSAQLLPASERGPRVAPLSHSELASQRSSSALGHGHPVWEQQAGATGLMIVVADTDGRVLWRTGQRTDLRRGQQDGHGDGACSAEHSVGTSSISLT